MSTITASPANDPTNPIDYATSMASVVDNMTQNTLAAVGSVLSGLPSVSSMANGAYSFEGGVINQANQLNVSNATSVQDFMTQNTNQILPVVNNIAQMAAANQAASIQAANNASAAAANAGGKK